MLPPRRCSCFSFGVPRSASQHRLLDAGLVFRLVYHGLLAPAARLDVDAVLCGVTKACGSAGADLESS